MPPAKVVLVLAATLAPSAPADASSVRAVSFEELLTWTDLVVRVEPVSEESDWTTMQYDEHSSKAKL